MKKRIFGRQLSRESDTRRALFRSLIRALVINGKIQTSKAKAKAFQGVAEGLITLGKRKDVSARRKLYSILANDRDIADFVVTKIVPVFIEKDSGFTRLINLPRRVGDNSQMVRLEWSLEVEKLILPKEIKLKNKISDKNNKDKKKEKMQPKGRLAKITKVLKKK